MSVQPYSTTEVWVIWTLRLFAPRPVGFRVNSVTLSWPRRWSSIAHLTLLSGTDSTSSQLPLPTCLTSDVQVSLAPTPDAGPDSSKSACGSRNTKAFQSVQRRRLLMVSNTIVLLRLVSTLSLRCRLDGRTRAERKT